METVMVNILNKNRISQNGFTLLELLIVIAIIGILAAIVYPSFQDSVSKTRRTIAQAGLVELAAFMERRYTENSAYNSKSQADTLSDSGILTSEGAEFYTYSITSLTANSFTLQAAPKDSQSNDACGTLSLNNAGKKTAGGTNCW